MAEVTYFVRVDAGDTVERPRSLVRRTATEPLPTDEVYQRDGRWHPTDLLARDDLGDLDEQLVPVSAQQAQAVIDRWQQAWRAADERRAAASGADTGLRLAQVFDRPGPDGRPDADPARPALSRAERGAVAAYLRRAPVALRANGSDPDPFDAERGAVVPVHVRTDGVWVWSEALAYFAAEYGIAPEPELLAHIRSANYAAPREVAGAVLDRAADLVLGR
jgi:hypothetical protein